MNIVLIGYRGSGKTTVGRMLAARLRREFVDTDAEIVKRAGKSIREIFAAGGEPAFRALESTIVAEVSARDGLVIAAGGGVVLRPENVLHLKRQSKVIWLSADAPTLHARIQTDSATTASRPNLTAAGGLPEVQTLLAQRVPLYQAAADLTLDVTTCTTQTAVELLLALLPR